VTELPMPGSRRRATGIRLRQWLGRPLPFHVLAFASYPVLFLFAHNLAEVALKSLFPPLGRALVAAIVVSLVAGLVLRDLRRGALVAAALLVAWFTFGHVADLVAPFQVGQDLQLVGWAALIVLVVVASIRLSEPWLRRVTSALNIVAVVLVAIELVQVVPTEISRLGSAPPAQAAQPAAQGSRDIYYFIFDRYGSKDSLHAWLGVDNDLPDWLASKGFYVAADSRANYVRTTLSLAATLEMRPLDAVGARMGRQSNNLAPVYDMLQNNAAGRFLEQRGYHYIHVGSWFGPTQSIGIATENLHLDTTTDFEAILDETTFNPTLDRLLNKPMLPQEDAIHRENALWQFATFPSVQAEPGPKFVFVHVLLPHPPYVFNADGSYPTQAERDARGERETFRQQLTFTNAHIRDIITSLLSVPPDKQPIIVMQADEGPFPDAYQADTVGFDWTKAGTDQLETKFGILNAMFLPGDAPAGAPAPYQSMTSWNTFPILFDRYFGASFPLMPDRSYTSSSYLKPYDFADVTKRLPPVPGR